MLRKGKISDFDELYEIYMHKSVNPYLGFEIMSKEEFLPIFKEITTGFNLYVYEMNRKIIATCRVIQLSRRRRHVACIKTVATHPLFQRQGIGTTFMLEVINILKRDGIKRIELSHETNNSIAGSFYQSLGFKQEGILKKCFKREGEDDYQDEYFMALLLNE